MEWEGRKDGPERKRERTDTWKGWESDRSFRCMPSTSAPSLSSLFFTRSPLIFIRITKNNAAHRYPWPVESRPSNADYDGLQVYNWISMRERSVVSPCRWSSLLTPTRALRGEYSRELDFAELPKWQRVEFVLRATRIRWEHVTVEESQI